MFVTDPGTGQDHQVNTDPEYAKKDWYDTKLSKPCPMDHGDHELGLCTSFFSVSPAERIDAIKHRICLTCLDPLPRCRDVSGSSKCGNEERFMQMTCAECYVRQGGKNQAGTNVLLCTDPTHKKISKDRLIELSAQLFPGFSQSIQESMALSCSDLDAVKTNSQDLQLESYFNPETGEKEYMESNKKYHSQLIKLCT